jgi:hypothetical protein
LKKNLLKWHLIRKENSRRREVSEVKQQLKKYLEQVVKKVQQEEVEQVA